jgi:hypothetical protein
LQSLLPRNTETIFLFLVLFSQIVWVGPVIVKYNRDDMKEISETIVEENEMCGFENPNLVNI